jgi:hypothetical protein
MTSKLKRGDVWTVSQGAETSRRPRPVQDDSFDGTLSVTVKPPAPKKPPPADARTLPFLSCLMKILL